MSADARIRHRQILRVEAHRSMRQQLKELRYDWDLPRYAGGLYDLEVVAGGLYGLAVIAGAPKSGKSLLALRCALDTARQAETLVVYVDLELDSGTYARRLLGACGARTQGELPSWIPDHMRIIDGRDAGVEELSDGIAEQLDDQHERVLIVIDSINRLAKNQQLHRKDAYFDALSAVVSWARRAMTLSHGQIGAILVSEVNRAGQITGQDPEYAADCLVTLRPEDGGTGIVEVDFRSRSTAGFAGRRYHRDAAGVQFVPEREGAGRASTVPPPPDPDDPEPWGEPLRLL